MIKLEVSKHYNTTRISVIGYAVWNVQYCSYVIYTDIVVISECNPMYITPFELIAI